MSGLEREKMDYMRLGNRFGPTALTYVMTPEIEHIATQAHSGSGSSSGECKGIC